MTCILVVEGDTDLPIARKLLRDARLEISAEIDCAGKSRLDEDLRGYNEAARGAPWFVLRDLDQDAPCAGALLDRMKFKASRWMCFRLAVRELESWLLADVHAVARFFDVQEAWIPENPDGQIDPTEVLVGLARRSRNSAIRRAMVPSLGASTAVGPLYEAMVIEFGSKHWNLLRACRRSESLRRARKALRALGARWRDHLRGEKPGDQGL
jgi:hypothetical protein